MSDGIGPFVSHLAAGAVGGLVVEVFRHFLTKDRERISGSAARKRQFLATLRAWREEVGGQSYRAQPSQFPPRYREFRVALRREASLIQNDLRDNRRVRFDELIARAAGLTEATAESHAGLNQILDTIDQIIGCVDN